MLEMKEDMEAAKLREIYKQADTENREKMASAAAQLLSAQKTLGNDKGNNDKEQETMRNEKFWRKKQ
jgi:hypothetical protein